MDAELSRFKSEISLADFAQAHFGFETLTRESSRSCTVLKDERSGGKIIVGRVEDGHDVYFNVHDQSDNGTIIDFLQRRTYLNLGQLRKELRGWLPGSAKPAPRIPAKPSARPVPIAKDRLAIELGWAQLQPYQGRYLTEERGIDPDVIEAFGVRVDERRNACFGHTDAAGVTGWEIKNKGFTEFSSGGQKTMAIAQIGEGAPVRIVICESSIDSMSFAQLHPADVTTVYLSTDGSMSPEQFQQILDLIDKTLGAEVVLAHDADEGGDIVAAHLGAALIGVNVARARPMEGKDWNEYLQLCLSQEDGEDPDRDA